MNQLGIPPASTADEYVVVGLVQGHFGVKGWVKVLSYTRPPLEVLNFNQWSFIRPEKSTGSAMNSRRQQSFGDTVDRCDETLHLADGRWHGKGLIVRLDGVDNREAADRLIGSAVVVRQDQFEEPEKGEFYWTDLVGLKVGNLQGIDFGAVDHLVETGANDVLVVRKEVENGEIEETLVPWANQFVLKVSLEEGTMLVDWDAD